MVPFFFSVHFHFHFPNPIPETPLGMTLTNKYHKLRGTSFYFFFCAVSCARLGLVSLAYMWQQDQTELVEEMIKVGLEAIIVKVASLGNRSFHFQSLLIEIYELA